MDGRQTLARCRGFENTLVLTMRDRLVACCPCFETLASLAPQHEVVVFQQVRPHPEEAAKWPSRRMGCRFVIPGTNSASPHAPTIAGGRVEFSAMRAAPRGCSQRSQNRS